MTGLIVSYSGIRGIVGESLTPDVASRYGRAFAALLASAGHTHGRVLVGRDTRVSGEALARALERGIGDGFELVDLGIIATPTLQYAMRPLRAVGGVCVTASHNPAAWNGMKFFVGPDNTVLDGVEAAHLCALAESSWASNPGPAPLPATRDAHTEAVRRHVEAVCAEIDVGHVRAQHFRVAVDSARGAGVEITKILLAELGCEVVAVEAVRESEPLPENVEALRQAVVRDCCDLGVAQDLDADRLALVTEMGEAPGEERTLVLVLSHLLERFADGERVVVKNVVTTRAVDDVVRRRGATLRETRVGEVNLSRALLQARAEGATAFGGEGNGGVIYPPISAGRDSIMGIAFVLEALASAAVPLSVCLAQLPAYVMAKTKLARAEDAELASLYARIATLFPEATASEPDGLRLSFADGAWLSVRPSNTEPVLRLVVEATSGTWADAAMRRVEEALGERQR